MKVIKVKTKFIFGDTVYVIRTRPYFNKDKVYIGKEYFVAKMKVNAMAIFIDANGDRDISYTKQYHKEKECFKTKEDAQKYCDKKNELINFVKKSNISYISLFKKK